MTAATTSCSCSRPGVYKKPRKSQSKKSAYVYLWKNAPHDFFNKVSEARIVKLVTSTFIRTGSKSVTALQGMTTFTTWRTRRLRVPTTPVLPPGIQRGRWPAGHAGIRYSGRRTRPPMVLARRGGPGGQPCAGLHREGLCRWFLSAGRRVAPPGAASPGLYGTATPMWTLASAEQHVRPPMLKLLPFWA